MSDRNIPVDLDPNAARSAFPFQERDASGQPRSGPEWGLTKREYFAAMAMHGFAAQADHDVDAVEVAQMSVEWADALLEELAK